MNNACLKGCRAACKVSNRKEACPQSCHAHNFQVAQKLAVQWPALRFLHQRTCGRHAPP